MAVEYMDSTDHYNLDSTIGLKWTLNEADGVRSITFGGQRWIDLQESRGVTKTVSYQNTWIVGYRFRFTSNQGGRGNMCNFWHAGEELLASLFLESDQTLSLYGGQVRNLIFNTGTLTPPVSIKGNVNYYIEVKCVFSGSSPVNVVMTLHLNGTLLGNPAYAPDSGPPVSTGWNQTDLLNQSSPRCNYIEIGAPNIGNGHQISRDFYMANGTGGSVTNFAGDVKIGALFPNGDVLVPWTGSAVGNQYALVNEQFPDGDATYIESLTPASVESFDFQDVAPFTGSIVAVHYGAYHRKTDEGTRSFALNSGAAGVNEGPEWFPGDTYRYDFYAMDQDPATSAPWTQANFNAKRFGATVKS